MKMPNYVNRILSVLRKKGFEAYAVGGAVRDTLLGKRPGDWDICTSAGTGEIAASFRKTVPTGVKYGTVTVIVSGGKCEVTTFRSDGAYSDKRKPDSVSFVTSLKEDLVRRDFTVNAMAMDENGGVIDLFGGREDLRNGLIRAVGEPERRFSEDALRMLRAVRFSAKLGFEIEPATLAAIRKLANNAAGLSAERVREETEKILLSPRPEKLSLLIELGLLSAYGVKNADFSRLKRLPKKPLLRWCAFAYLTGGGAELVKNLRLPNRTVSVCGKALSAAGSYCGRDRQVLAELGPEAAEAAGAVLTAAGIKNRIAAEVRNGGYCPPEELAINGDDLLKLGVTGREIGEMKRLLAGKVTLFEVKNEKSALISICEEMKNSTEKDLPD